MTRITPCYALGIALAASVAIHVGAIGLLEPFVRAARQALAVLDEPPAMLSITLVLAAPPVSPAKASDLAMISPPREARRREPIVRLPASTPPVLPSAAEVAIAPREAAPPQPPISEPGPPLPTPDLTAANAIPVRGSGSSIASSDATAPATGPASAPVAYLSHPSPSYPDSARRDGQEGLTVVEVLVSKSGTPMDVKIVTTSGVAALDSAAVAGVKRWLFSPAVRNHDAIEARIRIPIRFRLNEDGN